MALEIINEVPDVDAIIVPTGGGGLLAGIAVAAKSMNPNIMIIVSLVFCLNWMMNEILTNILKNFKSAESERCPSFYNSMVKGEITYTPCDSTLADGLAVSMVGVNSFATARPLVDKSVQVSEEYIAIAILRLLELEKAVVEGKKIY